MSCHVILPVARTRSYGKGRPSVNCEEVSHFTVFTNLVQAVMERVLTLVHVPETLSTLQTTQCNIATAENT